MLLMNNAERLARNHEKIRILLNFLKEETYSDFKTLMVMFGFKDHKSLYTLLNKVVKMGLVQKHVMDLVTHKITLWGITNDGLAIVLVPEDKQLPQRFEPWRLSGWSLDHHLNNQAVRLALEKMGARNWIHGDRSTYRTQFNVRHRPDGLISLPDGRLIAIETERNLKTKARYKSIMTSHLQARTDKLWFYVFYIMPDVAKKNAIQTIFNSITHVTTRNQHVLLEQKHRDVFRFYTMEELKNLELQNYA